MPGRGLLWGDGGVMRVLWGGDEGVVCVCVRARACVCGGDSSDIESMCRYPPRGSNDVNLNSHSSIHSHTSTLTLTITLTLRPSHPHTPTHTSTLTLTHSLTLTHTIQVDASVCTRETCSMQSHWGGEDFMHHHEHAYVYAYACVHVHAYVFVHMYAYVYMCVVSGEGYRLAYVVYKKCASLDMN